MLHETAAVIKVLDLLHICTLNKLKVNQGKRAVQTSSKLQDISFYTLQETGLLGISRFLSENIALFIGSKQRAPPSRALTQKMSKRRS